MNSHQANMGETALNPPIPCTLEEAAWSRRWLVLDLVSLGSLCLCTPVFSSYDGRKHGALWGCVG